MRNLIAVCCVIALLWSCGPSLKRGGWEEDTYKVLSGVIASSENSGAYAVFDCDNTTIIHDVTHTLMVYQIENLKFASAPEHLFLDGLGDVDFPLEGLGISAREMGQSLADEYYSLKENWSDSLFQDFRARFLAFYSSIDANYDYGTLCLWEPSLSVGFSEEELLDLGRESLSHWLSQGRAWDEEWTSPDGRFTGVAHKGLVLTPEIQDLYVSLSRAGITPYICSASPEWLVELFCTEFATGLGVPPERIYGIRLVDNESGSWSYDSTYRQPFKEGKVACIDNYIAPLHGNAAPVLVAGDSGGDVAMLTAYPEMKAGLIIDWDKGGEIDELAGRCDGRYISQKFTKQ